MRSSLLATILVLGVTSACFGGGEVEPEQPPEVSAPWYNRSLLRRVFGDFDETTRLFITDEEELKKLRTRGQYLVTGVAACGTCHAAEPGNPQSPLVGGRLMTDSYGLVRSANITPDKATGIGQWNLAQVVRAIRASIDLEGRPLSIALHNSYRWMSDEDARAVAVYLFSQPPVESPVERRRLGPFERNSWGLFPKHKDVVGYVPALSEREGANHGRYLSRHVAQCVQCHTAEGGMFSGAVEFSGTKISLDAPLKLISLFTNWGDEEPPDEQTKALLSEQARLEIEEGLEPEEIQTNQDVKAREVIQEAIEEGEFPILGPDIRGGEEGSALAAWTEDDLITYLESGVTPDNALRDGRLCPWPFYRTMSEADKRSIANYLKTL